MSAVAEVVALKARLAELEKRDRDMKGWLHDAAHILIERVGADGPMNVEDVARRAVGVIKLKARVAELKARVAELEGTRKDLERTNQALGDAVMEIDALKARVAELEAQVNRMLTRAEKAEHEVEELERTKCTESERAILDEGHRLGWTNCTLADRAVLDAMAQVKHARLMQIVTFSTDELVAAAKAEIARRESAK
jgi:DNA repair exonuclease SbcCD ATPase subunit